MRRLVCSSALALLALQGCLLYTDPINSAPQVTIVAPSSVHPNERVTFKAQASDPDGDSVTLNWSVAGKCQDPKSADWAAIPPDNTNVSEMEIEVPGHDPFCVRAVAVDRYGAASTAAVYRGTPQNRIPEATLVVDPPGTAAFPLYITFRLTAGPRNDDDGDPLAFQWKGLDPSGADLGPRLTKCDPLHEEVRCLSADQPGAYTVSLEASDGVASAKPVSLTLPVLEDAAPCIEVTDPAPETGTVVLAVTAPPRPFEVRRVRDDGNPFPPSSHGSATFQWFTAREDNPIWTRELGYDRPTFDVSAARFEDARPGSTYRVRVEVRDPGHESPSELRALEVGCGDTDVCTLPEKCVRWVTWSVRFQ